MKQAISVAFVALCSLSLLRAGSGLLEKEGKQWLERNTAPAEVNVTGVYEEKAFGDFNFDQLQGKRDFAGDADFWKIDGVVSGKKAYLILSRTGTIEYSAVLDFAQPDSPQGTYASYLITGDRPGNKKLSLKRKSTTVVRPALGDASGTARVLIYMKRSQSGPGIYLDRRQLVWMDKGYISFRVDPGSHELYIKGTGFSGWGPENEPVKLDARAGQTYYYEAGRWGAWIKYWTIKPKEESIFFKDIKNMSPLKTKFVLMDSIVSLNPVSAK